MVLFLAAQVNAFGKILTPKGPVTLRCRRMVFFADAGSDFSTFQALFLITAMQIYLSFKDQVTDLAQVTVVSTLMTGKKKSVFVLPTLLWLR